MSESLAFAKPEVCDPGGRGLLLPFISEENDWPKSPRAFMYFALLCWCFLGVSIIADIFMASIEMITSKRKHYRLDNGESITVRVWNATVANLTLMALGSSAPEILLNVIEIFKEEFFSGELGPSTIVGSAAFNLLVIIAVCVFVIPNGESRTIKKPAVFVVTAIFSVFAYVWLLIILAVLSPDVIELWEGIITFVFFVVLVCIAYLADIGMLPCMADPDEAREEAQALLQSKMMESGCYLSDKDAKIIQIAMEKQADGKSLAARRLEVSAGTQAAEKAVPAKELSVGFLSTKYAFPARGAEMILELEKVGSQASDSRVGIEYTTLDGSMKSADGDFRVARGFAEIPVGQQYGAINLGQAPDIPLSLRSELDSIKEEAPNGPVRDGRKLEPFFRVFILHAWKLPNREHRASLKNNDFQSITANGSPNGSPSSPRASLLGRASLTGKDLGRASVTSFRATLAEEMASAERLKVNILPAHQRTQVEIVSDACARNSGQLRFEALEVRIPGPEEDRIFTITVRRFNGCQNTIHCHYVTEADTGRAGYDYVHVEGKLVFSPGIMSQDIEVLVKRKGHYEAKDSFYVVLSDLPGKQPVVVEDGALCKVFVMETNPAASTAERMMRQMDTLMNMDAVQEGNKLWANQFLAAVRPGSGHEDEVEGVSTGEWTLHIVAMPWKLLFASVPPTAYCGGWFCFCIALAFIGGVTAIIGDLANLMGCCLDMPSKITAITIVALGTSLPDAFASKVAAVDDPTADAAIGNVTGSNSVNVFLGLGLPWMIAALYWEGVGKTDKWRSKYPRQDLEYPNGGFVVEAGDLAFTVIVFVLAATMSLVVIWYRGRALKAELGGPAGAKTNTAVFFILLWFFYVSLASWKILAKDVGVTLQVVAIIVGLCAICFAMVVVSLVMYSYNACTRRKHDRMKEAFEIVARSQHLTGTPWSNGMAAAGRPDSIPQVIEQIRSHLSGLDSLCMKLEASEDLPDLVEGGSFSISHSGSERPKNKAKAKIVSKKSQHIPPSMEAEVSEGQADDSKLKKDNRRSVNKKKQRAPSQKEVDK